MHYLLAEPETTDAQRFDALRYPLVRRLLDDLIASIKKSPKEAAGFVDAAAAILTRLDGCRDPLCETCSASQNSVTLRDVDVLGALSAFRVFQEFAPTAGIQVVEPEELIETLVARGISRHAAEVAISCAIARREVTYGVGGLYL